MPSFYVTLKNIFPCTSVITQLALKETPSFTNSLMPIQRRDVGICFGAAATFVWLGFKMVVIHMTIIKMPEDKCAPTVLAFIETRPSQSFLHSIRLH